MRGSNRSELRNDRVRQVVMREPQSKERAMVEWARFRRDTRGSAGAGRID
jgi:hypothetical protein